MLLVHSWKTALNLIHSPFAVICSKCILHAFWLAPFVAISNAFRSCFILNRFILDAFDRYVELNCIQLHVHMTAFFCMLGPFCIHVHSSASYHDCILHQCIPTTFITHDWGTCMSFQLSCIHIHFEKDQLCCIVYSFTLIILHSILCMLHVNEMSMNEAVCNIMQLSTFTQRASATERASLTSLARAHISVRSSSSLHS